MESQNQKVDAAVTTETADFNDSEGSPNIVSGSDVDPDHEEKAVNTDEGLGVHAARPSSDITKPSTILPRKMAWSVPSTSASPKTDGCSPSTKAFKAKSFADIVAEQSQDRDAALAAYGDDVGGMVNGSRSLAKIEEEQKRLFSALPQHPPQSSYQQPGDTINYAEVPPSTPQGGALLDDDLDAEELRMMQIAMQQSLEVFNQSKQSNISISSNQNNSMGDDYIKVASNESEPLNPNRSVREEPGIPDDHIFPPTAGFATNLSDTKMGDTNSRNRCNYNGSNPTLSMSLNDKNFTERTLRDIERTEVIVDNPHKDYLVMNQRRRVSSSQDERTAAATIAAAIPPAAAASDSSFPGLSKEEAAAIEVALREADAQEEAQSLQLALQIQQEELRLVQAEEEQHRRQQKTSGNVRVMTREQLQAESARLHIHPASSHSAAMSGIGPVTTSDQPRPEVEDSFNSVDYGHRGRFYDDEEDDFHHQYLADEEEAGFRMNSSNQRQWNRRDRSTIIGPNNEVRSKHDVKVQGQTNAQILDLETNDRGVRAHIGNQAFNSFRKTMKRTTKGVATHGTGRAGSDTDATRGKALDPNVRLEISRAINRGLIERCNGAVKQGKEAIVYHANGGAGTTENLGFDVAVKVFKRIQEFKGRGEYVDGDPRYAGRPFRSLSDRDQLELWTEKEYRNLVRAHRAGVPVPTPLRYKDNVIFMRFMGTNGWPAPQIREIDMRKESKKWDVLYAQVMGSIRRLYVDAKLVHGDLSEYNILISPVFQVDHPTSSVEDPSNDLQTVIIDFGQAVDVRHPASRGLLERDLNRVSDFFMRQGVKTLGVDEALEFVVEGFESGRGESSSEPSVNSSQRSTVNA